jgi:uncharacterized protein (DUF2236 family)
LSSPTDDRANVPGPSFSPDIRGRLISGLALAPAGANVIMQLSRLPIGHAVAESKVESGSLRHHPVKRTRTTLAYIMIALFGTDHERATLRREINAQHRFVHSDVKDEVAYDALDPELQLWVAACMFRGAFDTVTLLYGPVGEEGFTALLNRCSAFATSLQVSESRWPVDRTSFEEYWNGALGDVRMDDVTRAYLQGLASLAFLPRPLARLLGPSHRFLTVGFLPSPFREELGLPWSSKQQVSFEWLITRAAIVNRHLPKAIREFPWNVVEYDTRRRIAHGRAVL